MLEKSLRFSREAVVTRPVGREVGEGTKIPAGTLLSREGRLDGQGRVALSFLPRHASTAGPMRYVVEATVSDVDRQVYSGRMARVVVQVKDPYGLRKRRAGPARAASLPGRRPLPG